LEISRASVSLTEIREGGMRISGFFVISSSGRISSAGGIISSADGFLTPKNHPKKPIIRRKRKQNTALI